MSIFHYYYLKFDAHSVRVPINNFEIPVLDKGVNTVYIIWVASTMLVALGEASSWVITEVLVGS